MWIMVLREIPQKIDLIKAVQRFDSIDPKQVTKVSKIKYQKVLAFAQLNQQASFDFFIFFPLVLARIEDLIFAFFPIFQLAQLGQAQFTYPFLKKILKALHRRFCSTTSVRLVGNNLPIYLLIRRILTSLELILNHEFYSRLLRLTDEYNNGKTVSGERFLHPISSYLNQLDGSETLRIV